jgi:hypothetical protein
MLVVPLSLSQAFEAQLVQRNVPQTNNTVIFKNGFGFILIFATSTTRSLNSPQVLPNLASGSCKPMIRSTSGRDDTTGM